MNWESLIENLEKQKEKHRELLCLLEEEEKMPLNVPVEALDKLNSERKAHLNDLKQLEDFRTGLLEKEFTEFGDSHSRLENLLNYCQEREMQQKLQQSREELMEIMNSIQKQNQRNEVIIRGRRHAIQARHLDLQEKLHSRQLYSGKGTSFNTSPKNILQCWV